MKTNNSILRLTEEIETLKGKLQALETENTTLKDEVNILNNSNKKEHEDLKIESLFHQTFDLSPIGAAIVGLDKRFIRCNQAFTNFLNYSEKELEDKTIEVITFPDDREIGMAQFQAIIKGEIDKITAQKRHITKDGQIVWGNNTISLVRDLNGKPMYFLTIIQDITEYKIANKALQESETKYKQLVIDLNKAQSVAKVGSWKWYIKENIVEWSKEMYKIFGVSEDSFNNNLTTIIQKSIHPEDRAKVEASNLAVIEKGKSIPLEYRIILPDGTVKIVWGEAGELITDKNSKPLILTGIVQDITEIKKAREDLQKNEELLKSIVNNSSDLTTLTDENNHLLFVSPQCQKILGFSGDKYIGKSLPFNIFVADSEKALRLWNHLLTKGSEFKDFEYRVIDNNNKIKWVSHSAKKISINGKSLGIQSTVRDITERKDADEALRASEDRFKKIFRYSASGMVLVNPNSLFIQVNPAFCKLLGYNENELLNKSFQDVTLPEDQPIGQELVHRVLLGEMDTFQLEKRYIHKNGAVIWGLVNSSLIRDNYNNPLYFVTQINDITDRKQAEVALLEAEKKYRTVADFTYDWEFWYGPKNELIYISPSCKRITGHDVAEFIDNPLLFNEIIHPDDLKRWKKHKYNAQKGIHISGIELRVFHTDGTIRYIEHICNPIHDANGNFLGIRGSNRDITKRVKAEMAESESDEKYRTLTEQLPLGVYRTTLNGKILFVNQALAHMLDFNSPVELYEHNVEEFFVDINDRKNQIEHWNNHPKETNYQEFSLKTVKGRIIHVRDTGKIYYTKENRIGYFEGVFEDITQQKLALEVLKDSEIKYRSLVTNITDLLCEIDENGNFSFLNDRYKAVLGYKNSELIGRNAFDLIHEDDRNLILEKFNTIKLNGGKDSGILRYKHKKGHYIYFDCRGTLFIDKGNSVKFVVISQDLTDKIESNRILNENEERYRLLFDNINTGVAIYKAIEIGKNFILVDINKAGERNSKVNKNDVIGRKVTDVFPGVEEIGLLNLFKEVWKSGKPKTLPLAKYFDGRIEEWVENYVFKLPNGHIVALYEDTSEKRKAEQLIKESEEQLNLIFNSAPVIMMLLNENTEILRMNNFGLDSTGVTEDQILGLRGGDVLKCVNSLKDPRGCGFSNDCSGCGLRRTVETTLKTKKNFFKVEAEAILLEGKKEKRHTVLVSTKVVSSNDPQIKVLVTIDDITKQKDLEKELINAKEKAEENDKLKSAFLANISHEIRTPMNGIMGFSEMLLKPNISDDKRRHFSNIITDGCQQLLGIINDVLDISKIETGQVTVCITDVNINEIILDMLMFFKASANKNNINLYQKKSLPDSQAKILTDGVKLKQIFTNLISNAVKFTKQGYIEYGYTLKDEMVEFYVMDTGIGINPELHQIIFERFRQVETSNSRTYGGTGLGLSISKALIELLGGEIRVESEEGIGTTFYFTLPYKVSEAANKILGLTAEKEPTLEGNTILVVEDEEINYLFLEEVLLQMNYLAIHAKNGKDAISKVESYPEIKLVLMDIKMPVMDGCEATYIIREMRPELPIIAQTAYALSREVEEIQKSGFDGFITKPINKDKLIELINRYLKKNA